MTYFAVSALSNYSPFMCLKDHWLTVLPDHLTNFNAAVMVLKHLPLIRSLR